MHRHAAFQKYALLRESERPSTPIIESAERNLIALNNGNDLIVQGFRRMRTNTVQE